MNVSSVRSLSDDALRHGLRELVGQDRATTVRLLIHMAEFDSRRLYREAGFSCMKDYCMNELRMSEDVACKRICVARRARRFPSIFVELGNGTLTLTAVAMLSRYLMQGNAQDLLSAAAGKTNAEIAELIAERFPRPDLLTLVQPLVTQPQTAARPMVEAPAGAANCQEVAARRLESPAGMPALPARVAPLAPQRYGVQFTISADDRALLRRAQELLGHQIPSGDEGQVFVRALRLLVRQLEKRKYGVTDKPSMSARESKNPRHVPARVKRAVRERDQGRCTFVAANGHRCETRKMLEFDHVLPVARGGKSTIGNLRLRCRAHNQYEAEQVYGRRFMEAKREMARSAASAP